MKVPKIQKQSELFNIKYQYALSSRYPITQHRSSHDDQTESLLASISSLVKLSKRLKMDDVYSSVQYLKKRINLFFEGRVCLIKHEMLLKALKVKPWWNRLPNEAEKVTPCPRSSSSAVQFGEDPVTQMEDLVVIKEAAPVCTSTTTNQNSVCIAQPWPDTFRPTQSPCGVQSSGTPQLILAHFPGYSPAHTFASTRTALPASCWDALFYDSSEGSRAFPAVNFLRREFTPACSRCTCTLNPPRSSYRNIIGSHFYVFIY